MKIRRMLSALALGGAVLTGGFAAQAQTVEEFYRQNDITMMVGTAAGGSTDFFARLFAPYLSKYIPGNPHIIIQNKPGASGLIVASEIQHTMPSDGSYIGTLQRNNFTDPLLSDQRVDFDPRQVRHLGSIGTETYVIFQYGENPNIQTISDALNHEMILSGTGAGAVTNTFPLLVNRLMGGNFRLIPGYAGNEEQALAIERGEVDGRASGQLGQWYESGRLHYVMQFGIEPHPELSGVPNVFDGVTDEETTRIWRFMLIPQDLGRIISAPAGVPEDRLAALREAFNMAAKDPDFIDEFERSGGDTALTTGDQLQAMADELMGAPPELVERIKALLVE